MLGNGVMDLLQCDRGRNEGTGEPKPRVSICHERRRRASLGQARRAYVGAGHTPSEQAPHARGRGMCAEWSGSPLLVLGTVLEHGVDQKTRIVLREKRRRGRVIERGREGMELGRRWKGEDLGLDGEVDCALKYSGRTSHARGPESSPRVRVG